MKKALAFVLLSALIIGIAAVDVYTQTPGAAGIRSAALRLDANSLSSVGGATDKLSAITKYVDDVTALAALTADDINDGEYVQLRGYTAAGDSEQALLKYDSAAGGTPDNGLLFDGPGSVGRFVRQYSGRVSVCWFGAIPGDATDDVPKIVAAVNSINAIGGGVLEFPEGEFQIESETANDICIPLKSNLTIKGTGNSTVLKLGDGMSTSSSNFVTGIFYAEDTTPISNLIVRDLYFDMNGTNNLIVSGMHANTKTAAIGVEVGSDIEVSNVYVFDNGGRQCFAFGNNTSPHTISNCRITDCTFEDCADAAAGGTNQYQTDHSAIYVQSDGGYVRNCRFINPSLATITSCTAIECHSVNFVVQDNQIDTFGHAFNIVATATDHKNVIYKGNVVTNGYRGFVYWNNPPYTMDNITIEGNIVEINEVYGDEGIIRGASSLTVDDDTDIRSITVRGNRFAYTGTGSTASIATGLEVRYIKDLLVANNSWTNLPGPAYIIFKIDDAITDISISGDKYHGMPRTSNNSYRCLGLFNEADDAVKSLSITNCEVVDAIAPASGNLVDGFRGPAAIGDLYLASNKLYPFSDDLYDFTGTISNSFTARVSVKDFGATGNGTDDDHDQITLAVASVPNGGELFFPRGTYNTVGSSGNSPINLFQKTDVTISGEGPSTVIKADPTKSTSVASYLVRLEECTNITIRDLTLDGNQANRGSLPVAPNSTHNCFVYSSCSNITFERVRSINSTADGFYVASTTLANMPTHITLSNCIADANHRNGLSVIMGEFVDVIGGSYSHSLGSKPEAGIDVEPNDLGGSNWASSTAYTAGNIVKHPEYKATSPQASQYMVARVDHTSGSSWGPDDYKNWEYAPPIRHVSIVGVSCVGNNGRGISVNGTSDMVTIDNCHLDGNVTGGIVADGRTSVTNCTLKNYLQPPVWLPSTAYVRGAVVTDEASSTTYHRRLTAGTSAGTWAADAANWSTFGGGEIRGFIDVPASPSARGVKIANNVLQDVTLEQPCIYIHSSAQGPTFVQNNTFENVYSVLSASSRVNFVGNKIDNSWRDGPCAAWSGAVSVGSVIQNNEFRRTRKNAIYIASDDIVLEGNAIKDPWPSGDATYGFVRIDTGSTGIVLTNNRFESTADISSHYPIAIRSTCEVRSEKNTVDSNYQNAYYVAGATGSTIVSVGNTGLPGDAVASSGGIVNVKTDFRAVGDFTTDDTAALQAAIDTGKNVYVPTGRYRITSELNMSTDGQAIFGDGESSIIEQVTPIQRTIIVIGASAADRVTGVNIHDLWIRGRKFSVPTATSSQTITFADTGIAINPTNVITTATHGFTDGEGVYWVNNGNTLPTTDSPQITFGGLLYVDVLTTTTFKLYRDLAMTDLVEFTDDGDTSGGLHFIRQGPNTVESACIYFAWANECSAKDCKISHAVGGGVVMFQSRGISVTNNVFRDIYWDGTGDGPADILSWDAAGDSNPDHHSKDIVIANNRLLSNCKTHISCNPSGKSSNLSVVGNVMDALDDEGNQLDSADLNTLHGINVSYNGENATDDLGQAVISGNVIGPTAGTGIYIAAVAATGEHGARVVVDGNICQGNGQRYDASHVPPAAEPLDSGIPGGISITHGRDVIVSNNQVFDWQGPSPAIRIASDVNVTGEGDSKTRILVQGNTVRTTTRGGPGIKVENVYGQSTAVVHGNIISGCTGQSILVTDINSDSEARIDIRGNQIEGRVADFDDGFIQILYDDANYDNTITVDGNTLVNTSGADHDETTAATNVDVTDDEIDFGSAHGFQENAPVLFVSNGDTLPAITPSATFAPGDVNITSERIANLQPVFEDDDRISFTSTGTLPSGLSAGTVYYINDVGSGLSEIWTAPGGGGSRVDLMSQGTGTHSAIESVGYLVTLYVSVVDSDTIELYRKRHPLDHKVLFDSQGTGTHLLRYQPQSEGMWIDSEHVSITNNVLKRFRFGVRNFFPYSGRAVHQHYAAGNTFEDCLYGFRITDAASANTFVLVGPNTYRGSSAALYTVAGTPCAVNGELLANGTVVIYNDDSTPIGGTAYQNGDRMINDDPAAAEASYWYYSSGWQVGTSVP